MLRKRKEEGTVLRSVMRVATLALVGGHGRGLSDLPWPSPPFSFEPRRSACRFFLGTSEAHASFSPATMNQSSSSSHDRWLGAARWKQSWNVAWKGWDDSSATTSPISEQVSDEQVITAFARDAAPRPADHSHFPNALTDNAL